MSRKISVVKKKVAGNSKIYDIIPYLCNFQWLKFSAFVFNILYLPAGRQFVVSTIRFMNQHSKLSRILKAAEERN